MSSNPQHMHMSSKCPVHADATGGHGTAVVDTDQHSGQHDTEVAEHR